MLRLCATLSQKVGQVVVGIISAATIVAVPIGAGIAEAGDYINHAPGDDFDCDGARDAVQGEPRAGTSGKEFAGAVQVRYSTTGEVIRFDQDTTGIPGAVEAKDQFGAELASFDHNGDDCDDLVVSAPYEAVKDSKGVNRTAAGMVWIIPGSPAGLNFAASVAFHQDSPGIPGAVASDVGFGVSLATGYRTSREPYLLIGAPLHDVNGKPNAGAVFYWRNAQTVMLTQDSPGVGGTADDSDQFGHDLSASDRFIAVSSYMESIGDGWNQGMVHAFTHTATDGSLRYVTSVHQDSPGISGVAEDSDWFGYSVSIMSYRPTPQSPIGALLAVGVHEDIGSIESAGMAHLISITTSGSYTEIAAVHQNSPGVADQAETSDEFGHDVVLATQGSSSILTPATALWAVIVGGEQANSGGYHGAVHVFSATTNPGDSDKYPDVRSWNRHGATLVWGYAEADSTHLYYTNIYKGSFGIAWTYVLNETIDPPIDDYTLPRIG